MKEKKNINKEKIKKISFYKILSTITMIISLGYITYSFLSVDNIFTNITYLSTSIFTFIISLVLFIIALKNNIKNSVIIILSSILILFMSFNFMNDINFISLPQDEKIVSYVNTPYSKLNEWAEKNNIDLTIEYEYSDTIASGNIIRLDVNEGTKVKDITKITATISEGPNYDNIVVIPSMIGWNVDDVVKFIDDNHIIGLLIEYEFSDEEKDAVIKQNKNGDVRRDEEWLLTMSLGLESELPETVEIIDLSNMSLFNATLWLKRNNIKYELDYEFSNTINKNIVLSQNIDKGETINIKENEIILTISKGKAIIVPDLLNMTTNEITSWIIENKLKVSFDEIYDEKIESGKVISSSVKKDEKIESGTLVTITISKGQIKMQKFSSLYEFKEWANKYRVEYSESYEYSNSISKGNVISYSYNENDIIDPDEVIYVKVSLGKAITIPSFIGKTKAEASSTCSSIGIKCSFTTGTYTNYKENVIYSQSKKEGTKVASGTTITLILSKGIPATKNLAILQNWLSIGNADATISSLQSKFSEYYPGVSFKFIKVSDNSLNSGMIALNSPTTTGTPVKQGNTYTIYIVSN